MAKKISKMRLNAAIHQGFRCCYCGLPMWEADPLPFAAQYNLTKRQVRLLQCTAEHLCARSDGGFDERENIAAACQYCNAHRHFAKNPKKPEQFRAYVQKKMKRGAWLAATLPKRLIGSSQIATGT